PTPSVRLAHNFQFHQNGFKESDRRDQDEEEQHMRRRILFAMFAGIFVLAMASGNVWAQATAQISGSARDQSAAVLPGVEVTVTQTETGITRNAITNETGSYVL